jgi:S1-C subfamily serine protease
MPPRDRRARHLEPTRLEVSGTVRVVVARRRAPLVVAVALGVAGCGGGAGEPGASAPTVVRVIAGDGPAREVATGWVAGDGRVMTVAHALQGAARVRVVVPGGGGAPRAARVLARSARMDVAVLAVDGLRAAPRRASRGQPGQRAQLWVLRDGRPRALPASVRRAITARVHAQPGDPPQVRPGLEVAVTIAGGDSGAPLVDADGQLLGVAFARADGDGRLAYAVAAPAAVAILRAAQPGVRAATARPRRR